MSYSTFNCTLLIKSLSINIPSHYRIFIVLSLDSLKIETKTRTFIDPYNKNLAIFNECLTFPFSLPTTKRWTEKKATLAIYTIAPPCKIRALGVSSINLANYCNKSEKLSLRILNCSDKNAHLEVEVNVVASGADERKEKSVPRHWSSISETKKEGRKSADRTHSRGQQSLRCKTNMGCPLDKNFHNVSCNNIPQNPGGVEEELQLDQITVVDFKENSKPTLLQRDTTMINLNKFLTRSGTSQPPVKISTALTTSRIEDNAKTTENANFQGYRRHMETLVTCLKKQLQEKEDYSKELLNRLNTLENEDNNLKQEYHKTDGKLKEQEEESRNRLNEINKLQSELNVHKVEIAALRLQLADRRQKEASDFEQKVKALESENQRLVELAKYNEEKLRNEKATHIGQLEDTMLWIQKLMENFSRKVEGGVGKSAVQLEKLFEMVNKAVGVVKTSKMLKKTEIAVQTDTTEEEAKELLVERLELLQIEHAKLLEKQSILVEEPATFQKKVTELETEIIPELKAQNQKQTQNLKKCIQECRRLKGELDKRNSENTKLVASIKDFEERLIDSEYLREQLNKGNISLQNTMKSQNERIATLESDLIRTKQDLAEVLNTMHELEVEHPEYRDILEGKMTFKENSPC